MICHIHSDCAYIRYGISSLVEQLLKDSIYEETVHVFDLIGNSHPLHLLGEIDHCLEQSPSVTFKVVVICDEATAMFLRRYNILCITPSESIMDWIDLLRKLRERKWQDVVNIWRLRKYYDRRPLTDFDIYLLDCRVNGHSFSEISEMSGVSPKTIYSRYRQLKLNFNLTNCNFHVIYNYLHNLNNRGVI